MECGYCTGRESTVLSGGSRETLKIPALVGLLQHPLHGNILFDTGYSERFYEATAKWPAKLTAILLPTYVKPEESAKNKLAALGIAAEDISYIIVSHFHVDHICGLKDFPNAKFVCSAAALDNALKAKGFWSIIKGVIPSLLPVDLEQRSLCFDVDVNISKSSDDILGDIFDLFGDASVRLMQLPGHHNGQIGAILNEEKGRNIFLCADACWLSESFKENRLPSGITKMLITDWKAYKNTIELLHLFYKKHPEIPIIPTHCRKSQDELKAKHPDLFL